MIAARLAWLRRHPIHRILLFIFYIIGRLVALARWLLRLLTGGRLCKRRTIAQILAEAEAVAGSSDYGEDGEREAHEAAFKILLKTFEQWLPFGPLNSFSPKLAVKLRLVAYLRRHPSLAAAPVRRPVFIISLPRSGSTLLHNLLALDSNARAMRAWELRKPLPPPTVASFATDERIQALQAELDAAYKLHPLIETIHHVTADSPDECVQGYYPDYGFPTYSWGAEAFDAAYKWYTADSMRVQFVDYKRLLQVLCSEVGVDATHTVLKAPHHLFHLQTIAETFPGASFVWLHRSYVDVVHSCCLMNLHVHEYTSVAFEPPEVIGRRTLERLANAVHAAQTARETLEAAGTRFVDVSYDELKADPAACCEAIYAKLGLPWRAEVGEAIVRHLESEESAGRSRRLPPNQRLTLEEFGLDRLTLLRPFYALGEDRWWGHTPAWNGGVKPWG